MSKLNWGTDGRITYFGHDAHISKLSDGELIAHFDDDDELIIDCAWFEAEDLAQDAFLALREDGNDPTQWRFFGWEKYACLAAGLKPWETTLIASKACAECGQQFGRDNINANSAWGIERGFQRAKICGDCVASMPDPIA